MEFILIKEFTQKDIRQQILIESAELIIQLKNEDISLNALILCYLTRSQQTQATLLLALHHPVDLQSSNQ